MEGWSFADVLIGLERLAPVEALKSSFVAYPLVNGLHVFAIGSLVSLVLLMDLGVLGRSPVPGGRRLTETLRPLALGAFGLALATGIPMFAIRASEYAFNPAFRLKMLLLMAAGMNLAIFILVDRKHGARAPYSPAAKVSAIFSMLFWPAILLCGRFIGFV